MALRTGYPSWMQEDEEEEDDDLLDEDDDLWDDGYEDRAYEERRDRELFGD